MKRALVQCLVAAHLAVACGTAEEPAVAPLTPRATLVLEPPTLAVGDVAAVELAVVTPPEHRVRPYAPPAELSGFWVLDAEALPTARKATHWIHRTRVRVRAREVGSFAFPAGTAEVEAPDGEISDLPFEAIAVEVVSVLPEYPDRLQPFGAISPPGPASGASALAWTAAGACLALSCVGLVWIARRRAEERRETATQAPPVTDPPWQDALRRLAKARARSAEDPIGAANAGAACLRNYAEVRFRADIVARTTEELEASAPPFLATTRWSALLALLRRLDDLRFPRADDGSDSLARQIDSLLAEGVGFIEDSISREERAAQRGATR